MKREILGATIAAACIASGSALADGYDDTGAVYISPMANYTFLDKNRLSNSGAGYQVGAGIQLRAEFRRGTRSQSERLQKIPGTGASEKLNALSIDMLYKFLPVSSLVRPYALLGWRTHDRRGGRPWSQQRSMAGRGRRRRR